MRGIVGAQQGPFGRVTLFRITEPVAEHAHPHVHLLFKVDGNDRGLMVGGEQVLLCNDNCVLVSPWQRHADIAEYCDDSLILALYLDCGYLEGRCGPLPAQVFRDRSCPRSPRMQRLVRELRDLLGGDEGARGERFELSLLELVDETLHGPASGQDLPARASDYRIRRAMAQLREGPHLHPDFRLVASNVGLSRSRFFEQFKSSVGIAPTMYVDGLLLEQAIELLVHTDRSIEDISSSLGFSAQSSFTRFFKDRVGFPPNALRHAVLLH